MPNHESASGAGAWLLVILGVIIAIAGLALFAGGVYLATLGGSLYFALAGFGLVVSGALVTMRRSLGVWLYAFVFLATIAWSLWEVGLAFWPLVSRLVAPAVIMLLLLLIAPIFKRNGRRSFAFAPSYGLAAVVLAALAATGYQAFQPQPVITAKQEPTPVPADLVQTADLDMGTEWQHYGRQPTGTRYAPISQITPANVGDLEIAWTYRTGEIPTGGQGHVATPLQVGNQLFACTQSSVIIAIDAETGSENWRFDPQAEMNVFPRCRGVSYYETTAEAILEATAPAPVAIEPAVATTTGETEAEVTAETTPVAPAPSRELPTICLQRVVSTTVDARLVTVDALTGEPCPDFGTNGIVDLKEGMGPVTPGYYYQTSAPTVMRDVVIVGGWVFDNQEVGEPSGVIRAFSAITGELVWAFDVGNPELTGLPPEGETYTPGTPNVWTTPAFDNALGLVYLPTGNATPDYVGAHRTEVADEYNSAIVAVNVETGREVWKFRTMNHDVWDQDLPSQPALYDIPNDDGSVTPAIIQTTKRGDLFILNRETGEPITPIEERPAPQGAAEGEWVAETQPYQTGMPGFGNKTLTEADMWGATPFDQLYCRIWFKQLRYDGAFTPITTTPSLLYPGIAGGMNWGSSSVAENIAYLIVNDMRVPNVVQLFPREQVDAALAEGNRAHGGNAPQRGTEYGFATKMFMSPLGIPCATPPYGTVSAVDLRTHEVVWQQPMGTIADRGPFGTAPGLQIPIGMPTLGGPITTETGLVFFSGTQDNFLRALDVKTGDEIWKGRLPVAGETTPMTYVSPESGRQFVVISAGGGRNFPDGKGDYIIGFALPEAN